MTIGMVLPAAVTIDPARKKKRAESMSQRRPKMAARDETKGMMAVDERA